MMTLLSLTLAAVLGMQEVKRDERSAEEVAQALCKTAQAGFAFSGEVADTPSKDDRRQEDYKTGGMGFVRSRPLSGTLSGFVAAPFQASARVKSSEGGYEMFHEDCRTVERLACTAGMINPPLDAAPQLLFLLNLEEMAMVESLATRIEAGGEATVGDVKCRRFDMTLPDGVLPILISSDEDREALHQKRGHAPDRTLDVTAWVGNDDGHVHRIQAVFHYQREKSQRGFAGDVNFDITLRKHGAAEVESPLDLQAEDGAPETAAAVEFPRELKRDENAAAEAATALRKTAQAGFAFTGGVVAPRDAKAKLGAAFARAMGLDNGMPLSGGLSGSVAAPFRASAQVKSADGCYELFHEGDRMKERLACRAGAIEAPLDAAPQVLFLLDLEQMAKSVETLATGAQAGDEANCRRFDMSLPEYAIPVILKEDPLNAAFRKSMAPAKTLDVTAWVDKDDGRVHRLRVVFHYRQKNQPAFGITGDIAFDVTLQEKGTAK